MRRKGFKRDKNQRKRIMKFKAKNFHYNSKKCSKCKKRRKSKYHHYLCENCAREKRINWLKSQGIQDGL